MQSIGWEKERSDSLGADSGGEREPELDSEILGGGDQGPQQFYCYCYSISHLIYDIMTAHFTQRIVGLQEMRGVVKENRQRLQQFVGECGARITREAVPLAEIEMLKRNYQTLITVLNEDNDPGINNFSLHFILTISSGYLKFNKVDQAKEILKKSEAYQDSSFTDPVLLAGCLNNLANVQKLKHKHFKSLRYSLKALEVMQAHMDGLRQRKDRLRMREDAVVFLIVVIRCKLTLRTILSRYEQPYFRRAYELMNYMGYRSCLKYLGEDSIFIKHFTPVEREFHLPVFKTESKVKQDNENERLILEQLGKIHDVLKSKTNQDLVVANGTSQLLLPESQMGELTQSEQSMAYQIRELAPIESKLKSSAHKESLLIQREDKTVQIEVQAQVDEGQVVETEMEIERQTVSLSSELQKVESCQKSSPVKVEVLELKEETPQYVASESDSDQEPMVAEETLFIDQWEIKLRHERGRGESTGTLLIESFRTSTNKRKRQTRTEEISEEKLEKIVSQINYEDKLPYELFNEQLNEQEFIEYSITPYLNINSEGEVGICPKARGLLDPFRLKLFNQESIVFFSHVRTNLFRISVSAEYSSKSTYLNVEFGVPSMERFFSFEEETNDFLTLIYKGLTGESLKGTPESVKDKNKNCKIVSREPLVEYIRSIVEGFQKLVLHRDDETAVNQILENELFYYKFREGGISGQGVFHIVRYLPSIGCFDVYLQNNYETYSIEGQSKARGSILYGPKDFRADFGVPLRCSYSKNKLFAYLEIIARKYVLMTFEAPLTEADHDAYVENAILQFPITENCFRTRVYFSGDYCKAITVSLLAVNNQFPVGIKVADFSPDEGASRGFFIHIVPQEWARPLVKRSPTVNKVLFKTFISEFNFRKDYFIAEWLENKGFNLLLERLLDPSHQLSLQSNLNRFIRGKSVIQLFNDSVKH